MIQKICLFEGCNKRSLLYGPEDNRERMYCSKAHAPSGFKNKSKKSCEYRGCNTYPMFNFPGNTTGVLCRQHKLMEMVDVRNRRCIEPLCSTQPRFGARDDRRALYCWEHKRPLDINKVEKRNCQEVECNRRPTFASLGCLRPERCGKHKQSEDIDVISRKCSDHECNRQPSFGYVNCLATHCSSHRKDGMINTRHKLCERCGVSARYGFPGQGDIFCAEHRENGTIHFSNKQCITDKCRLRAEYGITKHEHCEFHKDPLEINLVNRKCSACGLPGALNRNEQCETCRPEIYEKKALYKQKTVMDFLKAQHLQPTSEDRMLDKGECGKERPDIYYSNDDQPHTLICEIDEDQHHRNKCSRVCKCDGTICDCDITRMKNIQQNFGGRPGYFVRFNPDEYKDHQKKTGKDSDIQRLKTLERWIRHLLVTPPTEFLQVVYLYYDEFDPEKIEVETLVKWERDE